MIAERPALVRLEEFADLIEKATDKAEKERLFLAMSAPEITRAVAAARLTDPIAGEHDYYRCRTYGIPKGEIDRVAQGISRQVKALATAQDAERGGPVLASVPLDRSLGDLADGANVPTGLRCPPGYTVTPNGVGVGFETILRKPLFIAGLSREAETGAEYVVLRWHDGRVWRDRLVPRASAMVARKLADESLYGVPVSSATANDAVAYFDAFLAENEPRLPVRETAAVQGWTEHGFLWGSQLLGPDGPIADPPIRMATTDPGMRQFLEGYRAEGTFEAWCAAVVEVKRHPLMMIALLCGMAAPLIRIVGAPNGIMDLAGLTGRGKTTAERLGASPWGLPDDKLPGLIRLWDASPTFIERYCTMSCDMPVFLDDTRRVKNPAFIGKLVYMIAQGQGKGRGTINGVQESTTWRTTCMSSGENPITEYAQEGGAAARVLTFWGSPLDSGETAEKLSAVLMQNHGHAGPRLVSWLQKPGNEDRVREWYAVARARWAKMLKENPVALRGSQFVALLETAEQCCREIGVPRSPAKLDGAFLEALQRADDTADKATLAMRDIYAWCVQNGARFYGRHDIPDPKLDFNTKTKDVEAIPIRGEWLGRWKRGDDEDIAILPAALNGRLKDLLYDAGAVRRTWNDRGWLRAKGGGDGLTWPVKINSAVVRCVVIRPEALTAVGEGSVEDP